MPSRSDSAFDGINMTQFHEVTAGGESDEIAPDPDDPDIVYGGRVDKLDLKSGQTRNVDPTLAFPGEYRGEWTLPLTFGQARPCALFRQPAHLPHARRRPDLDADQPRPDARPTRQFLPTLDAADGEGYGHQGTAARRDLRHRHLADAATG